MIKVGDRLRSVVCDTEVIAIRAPADPVRIACGGSAMVPVESDAPAGASRDPVGSDGAKLGKRYVHEELGLEVLVTKAGKGPLEVDGVPLEVKQAKPLPSSD